MDKQTTAEIIADLNSAEYSISEISRGSDQIVLYRLYALFRLMGRTHRESLERMEQYAMLYGSYIHQGSSALDSVDWDRGSLPF